MIKKLLKSKKYLFIGILLTAGVIAGIIYNIILSNNKIQNTSNLDVADVNYNNLQEQINELKTDLENTKNELQTTTQELTNAKEEILVLNSQVGPTAQNTDNNTKKTQSTADSTATQFKSIYEKEQKQQSYEKEQKQQSLVEEKEKLTNEKRVFDDRLSKKLELEREKSEFEQQIHLVNLKIKEILYATPALNLEAAKQILSEYEEKLNLTKNEETKKSYERAIEELKSSIQNYESNMKKIEELELSLKQLEKEFYEKNFDNRISQVKLSETENKRYAEICSRIEEIEQELLKY